MDRLVTQFKGTQALTDRVVRGLPRTPQRVTIRDEQVHQLILTCGARTKTWFVHGRVNGRTRRVRLGLFPALGVDEAREKAIAAVQALYKGQDPTTPRQPALTLSKALDLYLEGRRLKESSADDCRQVVEKHAASWLARPVAELTPDALARQYRAVCAKSVAAGNKLMRNISAVARFAAVAHGAGDAEIVRKAKVIVGGLQVLEPKSNVIPDDLQRAWFAEVDKLQPDMRALLLSLALTGCRRDELRQAPASTWDSGARVVRIATTKSGKPHSLPAGDYLVSLLDAQAGKVLFDVSEGDVRGAYERIGKAIGNPWTPHDLRRGVATVGARLGFEELVIKRLLNHAPTGVTQKHYVRLGVEDLRAPVRAIEAHFMSQWGTTVPQ